MTDNEQYTPTDADVRQAYAQHYAQNVEYHDGGFAEWDRWLAAHDAAILAAHRVTLVADRREALAKSIWEAESAWPDGCTWEEANNPLTGDTIGFLGARQARRLADALLASGVVQVTIPTETDQETPEESAKRRVREALDGLLSSPSVETVTPDRETTVREVLDWMVNEDANYGMDRQSVVHAAREHFGVSS